jgi:hypothetical protein
MQKLITLLTVLFLAPAAWAQSPSNTQGPIQYSANCAQSLRYGSMQVCYDTTQQSWFYWNYTANGGQGAFTASPISAGGVPVSNVGCPTAAKNAESEGCPEGAISPAAGTFTQLNSSSGALNGSLGQTTAQPATITNLTADGDLSLTGTQTNGADQINHASVNGEVNIQTYGAVGGGTSGQDNTTDIQDAINAVPTGGSLLIPAASSCYLFTNLTIPHAIHIRGQGWNNGVWGETFGSGNITTWKGSVLCSNITTGRAIDYKANEDGGDLRDFAVVGSGTNGSSATISSCTDSSGVASCTTTAPHGFSAGEPVFISGNSIGAYNGVVYLVTASGSSLTYSIRNESTGLSTGTGGTIQSTSAGLSIGDLSASAYTTGVSSYHVGVGNFGIGWSFYTQNGRFFHPATNGNAYDGYYSEVNSNENVFTGITAAGGQHINIDWPNGAGSDLFNGGDLETTILNDTTSSEIYTASANSVQFDNLYLEEFNTNTYTGDCIYIDTGNNAISATLINVHVSCGTGADSSLRNAGANTTVIGGQYGTILQDTQAAGARQLNLLGAGYVTLTNNGAAEYITIAGPGTGGFPGYFEGTSVNLNGTTSGTAQIVPPAVAGTPTLTLPTTSGTFVTSTRGQAAVWAGASAGNAQGATDYLQFGSLGSTAAQGTQATAVNAWPFAGTASNLRCHNATAADNSTGITYTIYGGSAGTTASSVTCSTNTSGSTTSCSDTTDTFTVAAGDLLNIKIVNANSSAANGVTSCSFLVNG